MMPTHVLLLRTPSDGQPDPYAAHFSSVGLPSTSLQVLKSAFTNLDELQWMIETGPGFHGFKGVVVTSARSVEAWERAVEAVVKRDDHAKADWTKCPFYVVGEATASAVEKLRATLPAHLLPTDVLGGAESGTSEALTDYVLAHTAPSRKNRVKLLCLTGDKNRDTLASRLAEGGVELDEVRAYETRYCDAFGVSLADAVKSQKHVKHWWIGCFAPSSTDFALPALREHFKLTPTKPDSPSSMKSKKKIPVARLAAIGPTTASHITDTLSLAVDAVADKPTPAELAAAITSAT